MDAETTRAVLFTVMENVHELEFPAASLAVYCTSETPFANILPDAMFPVRLSVDEGQLSLAEGADQVAVALQVVGFAVTVILAGQTSTGLIVSKTVIDWLQVAVLPELSVAVHVTCVSPEE